MIVDPDLLKRVHRDVGDRLQREQLDRRRQGRVELSGPAKEQYARKLIADVLREHAEQLMARGQVPLEQEAERELAEGVHARMFGAGRLQVLLNDDSIENIDINGGDEVWVTRAGSATHERVDPVASTDEELIELVQGLAAYAGLNSRPWGRCKPGAEPPASRRVTPLGDHGRHRPAVDLHPPTPLREGDPR
jgi:pilus assembly protein CpaF